MTRLGWWLAVLLLLPVGTVAVLVAAPLFSADDLAALAANDPVTRAAAVDRLAASASIADLATELGQAHAPLVKAGLADAIARQGIGTTDLSTITALLTDEDAVVRSEAVRLLVPHAASVYRALGEVAIEEAETVPVRTAAVAALGSAGAQARSTLWGLVRDAEAPPAVRHAAIRALARVSAEGASDVGALAADGKRPFAERLLAVQALAQPTAPGSAVLAPLATSVTPTIRAAALSALAERGDTTQAALMANATSDPWANVRLRGLQGLRALGAGATYRTQVIGRLLDTDPRVLSLAAQMVGVSCGDIASQVIPSLKLLLASTNFRVRYDAALALFALGDTSGAATMLADQASPNPTQQRMAGTAYAQITAVKK